MPLTLGVLSLSCVWGQQYTISTYAGNRTAGFSGDGGAPTSAQLSSPLGLAFDSSGNLYIADSVNVARPRDIRRDYYHRGGQRNSGLRNRHHHDEDRRHQWRDARPIGGGGGLYRRYFYRRPAQPRRLGSGGRILGERIKRAGRHNSPVAGNNTGGYGGDGGLAGLAELDFPTGVAVDSAGNLYIADSGNDVIREVSGGIINTIVGLVPGQYMNDPESVLVDSSGNLYISEQNGYKISKFSNGVLTTIAGNGNIGYSGDNGPGVNAALNEPTGMALDSKGYLYFCDTANSVIRKISPDGIITTIAGTTVAGRVTPGYYGDGGPATSALAVFSARHCRGWLRECVRLRYPERHHPVAAACDARDLQRRRGERSQFHPAGFSGRAG